MIDAALLDILKHMLGTEWAGAALTVTLWPLLGWIAIRVLESKAMLAVLGRGLAAARKTGAGVASMPKAGILRLLFAPVVYLIVYGLAIGLAFMDGLLSNVDPEIRALADRLIVSLRAAGANDSLLYLQHKAMEPQQAAAVATLQKGLVLGMEPADAAQAAVLVAEAPRN